MEDSKTEYLISSGSRKTGREPGALRADTITANFARAVLKSGIAKGDNPPSFHEIRSLASRMYEREYGAEFAQKLLGHKSMKMTNVYLNSRGTEWTEI